MRASQRPRRFIVIPPPAVASGRSERSVSSLNSAPSLRPAPWPAAPLSPALDVLKRSAADGAVLLAPHRHLTHERLKALAPKGARVLEESWYRLDRPARPWGAQGGALKAPRVRQGRTQEWTVTVVVRGDTGRSPPQRRLPDARVTVMMDEAKGIGLEATTDRYGRARIELSDKTQRVDAVYVDPLHGAWPVRVAAPGVSALGLEVAVPPLDANAADARGMVYGQPAADAGLAVRVAVVDTGVGPHAALRVARGLNTTVGESSRRWRDEEGHGSHVAGVFAAAASGWRRGQASAAELHAYRVFEAGDPYASSFAIAAAIKDAAVQGCDLVNLSLGDSQPDEAIRDAIDFAWVRGCVCMAATGNDGKGQVDYPARFARVLAVSAMGLVGSWPEEAHLGWALGPARGKPLGGRQSFAASFSNRGAKVALTAPGVAIVSTIFGNRWGLMSGTSMATPIATGVLAARLAQNPAVLQQPRDAARSQAIVQLAVQAAEDIGLPAVAQGRGLAR